MMAAWVVHAMAMLQGGMKSLPQLELGRNQLQAVSRLWLLFCLDHMFPTFLKHRGLQGSTETRHGQGTEAGKGHSSCASGGCRVDRR